MPKHSIQIQRADHIFRLRITYKEGHRVRQVPERAVYQALYNIFNVPEKHLTGANLGNARFLNHTPDPAIDQCKPWKRRKAPERLGAILTAWMWLLAQDNGELRPLASPFTGAISKAIGKKEFSRICDELELSGHERMELVIATQNAECPTLASL